MLPSPAGPASRASGLSGPPSELITCAFTPAACSARMSLLLSISVAPKATMSARASRIASTICEKSSCPTPLSPTDRLQARRRLPWTHSHPLCHRPPGSRCQVHPPERRRRPARLFAAWATRRSLAEWSAVRRTQFENARSFVQYFNLNGVSGVSATYRRLLRREVVDICMLIFIADVVTGVQIPLFPLYTISLGASLGLLGVITAVLGLTRLASALPIGMLSDRLDRKTVLVGGMITFAISFVAYAVAPSAEWLAVPRALQAVAMVATFPLGIAYIGDVVETRDRGAAVGVYTAAMGSGFAVGPLLGSWAGANA